MADYHSKTNLSATGFPPTDLFADCAPDDILEDGAVKLRGFAEARVPEIWREVQRIAGAAPFRHMATPGGKQMSVAMTNCGAAGWVTDRRGYRYAGQDPLSGNPWPAMPAVFAKLAQEAAARAGYKNFAPDACLLNRYAPGARMTLHQDRDEQDFAAPIVSVSLGLPSVFLWGSKTRAEKVRRVPLTSGDVLVWGGTSRLNFHGILPLKDGTHPLCGSCRINLTFRKAL